MSPQKNAVRQFYGDSPFQFGDLRVPHDPGVHPAIVIIHGGFWRQIYGLDLMDEMAEDLRQRGYVTWNIEYRRVGQEGGGWPGTLLDVAAAIDYLSVIATEVPIDARRIGVIGHSAGGHLALWQAARDRMPRDVLPGLRPSKIQSTAVVALAAVTDMMDMHAHRLADSPVVAFLGGKPDVYPARYHYSSPIDLLPLQVPQLVIHGTDDDSVPLEQSQRYTEQARNAGDVVTMRIFEDTDHYAIIDPKSNVWPEIALGIERIV